MSRSVLPDAKARLVELLTVALPEVQVSWTAPPAIERQSLYFGRTIGTSDVTALTSGRKRRNESCTMTLVIDSHIPGADDAEDAERATFDIYGEVEDLLANDQQLIGADGDDTQRLTPITGLLRVTIDSYTAGPDPDIEGWSGLLVAQITVTARLD